MVSREDDNYFFVLYRLLVDVVFYIATGTGRVFLYTQMEI